MACAVSEFDIGTQILHFSLISGIHATHGNLELHSASEEGRGFTTHDTVQMLLDRLRME